MIPFGTKSVTLSMLIDLLTSTCRSTQVKIASTDLWPRPQEMFTFSEMLALVESESSFGAYVCHRRPGGSIATSDLVACVDVFLSSVALCIRAHEKRSAGTCWVSGVKFNHGSTSSGWRRLLAVETLAINPWHDHTTGEDLRARSIAIEVKHETLPANRTRCCLIALGSALHALHLTRTREQRTMHGLVMTGHNARRPRTGRERRPWWPPSEASYLTVWTLNDRFFASRVHCMLRRVLSEYWRKETEKSKVFCGVVGWTVAALPRQSREKNPWQLSTYRVLTCRQKQTWSRFVAWWERSLIPDRQTDTQTHTHTHTHTELKPCGPPGPRR